MSTPRSWNRREFNVAPTGWFTVLKPSGWFSASRLPGGFRYLVGNSKKTVAPHAPAPEHTSLEHAVALENAVPLQILKLETREHGIMRSAVVVLGACATAWLLLWWLIESQIF